MKASVEQQRLLADLVVIDADLTRIAHRRSRLPEEERYRDLQSRFAEANDRLAAVKLALEDLDAQASKLEGEIDAVRQREDRDRRLLDSGSANVKQLTELQHELQTLQRRQASLEDSLLEVMETREQLQAKETGERQGLDSLANELADVQGARDEALAEVERNHDDRSGKRSTLLAMMDPDLVAVYERQRSSSGVGAGLLQGKRCGACRIELDRGELARISAAAEDDVLRCPECRAILLRVKGTDR